MPDSGTKIAGSSPSTVSVKTSSERSSRHTSALGSRLPVGVAPLEGQLERDAGLQQRQAEPADADVEVGRDLVDGGVDRRQRAAVEDRRVGVARAVVDDHEPLHELADGRRQHRLDGVGEIEQLDERNAGGERHGCGC